MVSEYKDHSLFGCQFVQDLIYLLPDILYTAGMLGIKALMGGGDFINVVGIEVIVSHCSGFSYKIDGRIDADAVEPGCEICVLMGLEFIQGLIGFDECLLQDVLGIFFVSEVFVSSGVDLVFVGVEQPPEGIHISILG